jgi:hypothetical protein
MSNRSARRDAESRAEARRRARLESRGQRPDTEEVPEADSASTAAGRRPGPGGFLSNLFPPAPPLANQPDALAGFRYQGPLRPVVEALYLLARNPVPWLVGGLLWTVGRLFTDNSMTGLVASLLSFGGLIGAGWFAPWRPWLSGLAAGLVGWIAFIAFVFFLAPSPPAATSSASPTPAASIAASASPQASASAAPSASASAAPSPSAASTPPQPTPSELAAGLAVQTVLQLALGAGAGFYGGYLRRRMATTPQRSSRRR